MGALLGMGAMGAVYLGEQRPSGRPVAIKVLQPAESVARRCSAEDLRERLLQEARLLARVSHPAVVRLLDFGIACPVEEAGQDEEMMGTPRYLAPEAACMVTGGGGALDGRCDVYGVGVILYEGLSGRVPFDHPSLPVLLGLIREQSPPPLPYRGDLPPEVYGVVGRALAKAPGERFECARAMAEALRLLSWPDHGRQALREVYAATLELPPGAAADTIVDIELGAPPDLPAQRLLVSPRARGASRGAGARGWRGRRWGRWG